MTPTGQWARGADNDSSGGGWGCGECLRQILWGVQGEGCSCSLLLLLLILLLEWLMLILLLLLLLLIMILLILLLLLLFMLFLLPIFLMLLLILLFLLLPLVMLFLLPVITTTAITSVLEQLLVQLPSLSLPFPLPQVATCSALAKDRTLAKTLWEVSEVDVKLRPAEMYY